MALDTRDYFVQRLRKLTGYTEKAAFRVSVSEQERAKAKRAWRRNFVAAVALVALVSVVSVVRKRT